MSLGLKYVALGDSVNAVLQETYNLYLTHFSNYLKKYCQDFNSNVLMALKIEVQTLTINFCSSVDPLWICMKSKYPKSRKIQNRITSFEFMSPFHWNIAILNNVLFLIFVYVLILVMFWFWWCLFLFRECYSSLIPALHYFCSDANIYFSSARHLLMFFKNKLIDVYCNGFLPDIYWCFWKKLIVGVSWNIFTCVEFPRCKHKYLLQWTPWGPSGRWKLPIFSNILLHCGTLTNVTRGESLQNTNGIKNDPHPLEDSCRNGFWGHFQLKMSKQI